jgi:hypothetical protein
VQRPSATIGVVLALAASISCTSSVDNRARSFTGPDAAPSDATADRPDEVDAAVDAEIPDAPEDAPTCPILQTAPVAAGAARSAGFSGNEFAYSTLYGGSCQTANDCVAACVIAGATMASCASGSACLVGTDGGLGCLPPTYWLAVGGALSESGMTANAAHLVVVAIPYDDSLVLTNFGVSIPDDATVTGIQFRVRRATIDGNAVDDNVQILQNAIPTGTNHGQTSAWPRTLIHTSYGGADDLWGISWTPADIRATGFGISISLRYTGSSAGNEVAYIDSVRVTLFYTIACD